MPRRAPRLRRQYKIQEVIKRRQVLLVQVVKEERGNKGAALTTYLSLAGRYSVLMPNTARGGGISRKITNAQDRSRLKGIAEELEVPEGMGVILRTAGASRTKAEVKRDFEYLLRMWETVRETTLASSAPTLVYEEGSLIKRAIRDLYSKEVDEIVVAGEAGYREARQFMRLLMPSHVNSVQLYRDTQPVFAKAGVESQLDAMFSNQVTLKSGGYIVINQTEALVAIDVNSGRSTREHNIEDTALRTNLEAADEIARQLRLRDLAGLIVVDFIDMEESRNNRAVERRIKDALKNDRARIQVGRISHFGLLEMSRQRIRTGVLEGSTVVCAALPGRRRRALDRFDRAACAARARGRADQELDPRRDGAHAHARRALYSQPEARQSARSRAPLRRRDRRRGRRYADRRELPRNRARRAGGRRQERSRAAGVGGRLCDIVEEPAPVEEDLEETRRAETSGSRGSQTSDRAGSPTPDEGEVGRRRRRRRRRRGGERPFGESVPQDAPQPTDDGLAVVAEIGGDLQAPSGEVNAFDRRGPRSEEGRDRRSRRSRGQRNPLSQRSDRETTRETGTPSFDAPPSVALEEEFAASEADYSQAPPPPREAVQARQANGEPMLTAAHDAGVEPAPGSWLRRLRARRRRPSRLRRHPWALLRLRRPTPPLSQRPTRQRRSRRGRAATAGGSGRVRALSANSPIRDACESRVSAAALRAGA